MYRNGCAASDFLGPSTLAVVFFQFLISSVAAEDDDIGTKVALKVGLGGGFLLLGVCCKLYWRSSHDDDVHVIAYSNDISVPTHENPVVRTALKRTPNRYLRGNSESEAPKLPSGRYKGSRGKSGERVDVEYDLTFDPNGHVRGTLYSQQLNMDVQGWFCPNECQFEWAEGTHGICQNFQPSEQYFKMLVGIYKEEYSGTMRHAEVSMKVAKDDSGILSLVGNYNSSDGSQGDQRLIFQPDPGSAPHSSDPVCIEMPPLAPQPSESFETKNSKLEPTLEKEEL